jgi:site-specific DNA-adenine methylase
MQPFFRYFGGKWKLAKLYGRPMCRHVIEPFAGAAGYSLHWEPKEVTLIEQNPVVYGVWSYLRRVSPAEVMRLPANISHVDELPSRVCEEAKWLIGFWFDNGLTTPKEIRSNWARVPRLAANFWSESIKRRIASQVDRIRHWEIIEGSYEDAPDVKAHWHIDPPYDNQAGQSYVCKDIDHGALARWCLNRLGWRQVCENDGATWLPFEPLSLLNTFRGRGYSFEVMHESSKWPPRSEERKRRHHERGASAVRRITQNARSNKRHSRRAA